MTAPSRRARWTAGAALAVPVLVLCAPFLFSSEALYGTDFEAYHWAHFTVAGRAVAETGTLPEWNPYQYAGTPFQGNPQSPFYYPPVALFFLFAPETGFELFVVLHLLLAGLGMYRLTRSFGLGRMACVLAGVAYELSFPLVARIDAGHLPYFILPCVAPLFLMLLLRVLDSPQPRRIAALAAGTGMLLLGGTPQFLFHLLFVCVAILAGRLIAAGRGEKPWKGPAAAVAAALVGILISAIHTVPALGVASNSWRAGMSYYEEFRMLPWHSLSWADLGGFFSPAFPAGDPAWDYRHEKSLYVGIVPLLLAPFAVFARGPQRGTVIFFAVVALASLLAGTEPAHHALTLIPGYGAYRVPARIVWIAVLCLPVLLAFGWQAAADRKGGMPAALGAAAFVFMATDLCLYGIARLETVPRERYAEPPWYLGHLGEDPGEFRVLDATTLDGRPIAHGVRLLRGLGFPRPAGLTEEYGHAWEDDAKDPESLPFGSRLRSPGHLAGLRVKWIISSGPPLAPSWERRAQHDGRVLYEDRAVIPFDLETSRPTLDEIVVRYRGEPAPGLIIPESWMPGWTATHEGKPVALERLGGTRMSVPARAGEIRLAYELPGKTAGALMSLGGLLLLSALLIVPWWRRPTPRS